MSITCKGCSAGRELDLPFSMAFQPIVDVDNGSIFAHEALVRGPEGQAAGTILEQVDTTNRYAFDQQCRVKAIELASRLYDPHHSTGLSINFMPNAVYEPRACIRLTLETAMKAKFPLNRIIFEFTENEQLDTDHLLHILRTYRAMGFRTAIDDFGAGHAGLALLTRFQPDIVKLDMDLIRDIDREPVKRSIVKHTVNLLKELDITPVCEGVETIGELEVLRDTGISLVQGYLIARPQFESLATPRPANSILARSAVG